MSNIAHHKDLIEDIDAFLSETGMGVTYFGKKATGNSEVVPRLKAGRLILPTTEVKLRQFMAARRAKLARKAG